MNQAEIVGGGWAPGRLHSIAEQPVMVRGEDVGRVLGEVYRVGMDHLEELDRIMETVAAIVGNGRCRRVRVVVSEVKLNHPPMEAWTWQWEDLEGQHPTLSSGDWLNPGLAPLFTFIAFSCLLLIPVLSVALPLVYYTSRTKGTTPVPPLVSYVVVGLMVGAPVAGLYAAYLAHRRKERWSGCLLLIVIALAGLLLILGINLSQAFL
jgi:gamma-glutamylcyclotransferase (GGCT)/AIG2-like uncharacterized protein YtfP